MILFHYAVAVNKKRRASTRPTTDSTSKTQPVTSKFKTTVGGKRAKGILVSNQKLKVKVGGINKNEGSRGSGKKNVKEKKPPIQFRSNLIAVKSTLEILKLKEYHKKELKRTPFWNLFNAFFSENIPETDLRKSDKDIEKILRRFDETSKAFKLGSTKVKLTKRDISLIYGIKSTGKKSTKKYETKDMENEFVKRRFANVDRVTAANLKEMLKDLSKSQKKDQIVVEDVARLLCLYVIVVVFLATRGPTLSWGIVHSVEDLDGMNDIDWVEEMHSNLMKSISKSHKDPSKVTTGCTSVLPVSLLPNHPFPSLTFH